MLQMGAPVGDVQDAAREAGRQLEKTGTLPVELLRAVSRELMPRQMYLDVANQRFRETLQHLPAAS
jgi:hypothetical protein